jgi:hypothetical protein
MKKLILTFSVIAFTSVFSQEFSFVKLPFNLNDQIYYAKILPQSDYNSDTLNCYYAYANSGIYYSRSYDKGKNWSLPAYFGFWNKFDILNTNYKSFLCYLSTGLRIRAFEYNGNTIDTLFQVGNDASNLQIKKLGSALGVFYSRLNKIYGIISNDLINWSLITNTLYSDVKSFQILKLKNDKYFLAFTKPNENKLYYTFSDDMLNWEPPQILLSGISDTTKFVAEQNDAGVLLLALVQDIATPFSEHKQKDIFTTTSIDNGNNWSSVTSITKFKGDDHLLSITPIKNEFIISFSSNREKSIADLYFGFLPNASDRNTPPKIYEVNYDTSKLTNNNLIKFRAMIDDDEPLKYVKLKVKINNEAPFELMMNDNGMNGDERKSDKIYSTQLNRKLTSGDAINYYIIAEDLSGNKLISESKDLFLPMDYQMKSYSLLNNRYHLSFDNNGIFADVLPNYANFDDGRVLFSGGFLLSGYENQNLFTNAVFSASRINDYYPGIVGGSKEDPKNQIYIVRKDDAPFGDSWQLYKYATLLNAPFYDGDFDGVYNPVDKNNNGVWDEDEDAPEILGDITTWCVFNDAVPSHLRRFGMNPMGIEIQQSVFSFDKNENNQPDEKIYVRYRIINRGSVSEILDSVIFSFFIDPDIGTEYINDYMATDTTLNLVYSYSGSETNFGNNPPASGVAILQGPPVFIPGKTFIDNNSDGIFQSNIDVALDTAVFKNGSGIGAKKMPGAKNAEILSSYLFLYMHWVTQARPRNNQLGLNDLNQFKDVCNDLNGTVFGNYNCNEINPIFHYSGNPVIPDGWVMTVPFDITFLLSTGVFQLKKDEPVDIWGVYVAGRGVDSLDSIIELKKNVQNAKKFYNEYPINPERTQPIQILPTNYVLHQNYPNPFNSGTRIKFEIPAAEQVRLKLFDITGREIATLLNETRTAGVYEIILSSEKLSSGVYFYQIIAGNFISTKKCVVLK